MRKKPSAPELPAEIGKPIIVAEAQATVSTSTRYGALGQNREFLFRYRA